ncbi:MAG: hypothetical protein WCO23_02205 [bacterium]
MVLDIKKMENELSLLEESLSQSKDRIKESGDDKISLWPFQMECRIRNIKKKINDLKTGKTRSYDLTPEDLEIEKKLTGFEKKLEIKTVNYQF